CRGVAVGLIARPPLSLPLLPDFSPEQAPAVLGPNAVDTRIVHLVRDVAVLVVVVALDVGDTGTCAVVRRLAVDNFRPVAERCSRPAAEAALENAETVAVDKEAVVGVESVFEDQDPVAGHSGAGPADDRMGLVEHLGRDVLARVRRLAFAHPDKNDA